MSVGEEKSMDRFGDIWVGHTEKIKTNWLKLISEDDVVIMPGDFSWAMRIDEAAPDFEWLGQLPGKKLFVRGNHDFWWTTLAKMNKMYPHIRFIQNDSVVINGIAFMGSRGWIDPDEPSFTEELDRKYYERERQRLDMSFGSLKGREYETLICATHFPPNGFMDLFKKYGVDYAVYGHLHGEKAFAGAPEGLIDGTRYTLCSYDKLGGVPKLICRTGEN